MTDLHIIYPPKRAKRNRPKVVTGGYVVATSAGYLARMKLPLMSDSTPHLSDALVLNRRSDALYLVHGRPDRRVKRLLVSH